MDTNSLREMISRRSSLPTEQVDRFLHALTECVGTALRCNEDVVLEGLGVFNRPSRSDSTPTFQFLHDAPVAAPPRPPSCKIEGEEDDPHSVIADFLRVNRVFDSTFSIDIDPLPDLNPNSHPGVISDDEIRDSMMFPRRAVDPQMLADRVAENMRALIHG